VASTRQLLGAGLGKNEITRRTANGQLHRLYRGVYSVGHLPVSFAGRWMAAVLAYGDLAVLSHGSAAALWGLLRPLPGPVDVSVPTDAGVRSRTGIRLHRRPSLTAAQRGSESPVTVCRGIPVTAPARTIEDLRGAIAPWLLRRAIRQAELADMRLGRGVETDRTRSDLERDFLRFCRHHGLPGPEVNARIGKWTVDFAWRPQRVVVETDDFRYHRGSVAFEDDHARDLELRAAGYDVRRFTGLQIKEKAAQVAADLRDALAPAS
jgi:very-short-patch-repair endonuclease